MKVFFSAMVLASLVNLAFALEQDFELKKLPEGTIIQISSELRFQVGQTVIQGERDEYERGVRVVYEKDSKFERIVEPRLCRLKKVKAPFGNLISEYKIILTGDSVCDSLVLKYFAAGPAMYDETKKAASALGINIIVPEPLKQ